MVSDVMRETFLERAVRGFGGRHRVGDGWVCLPSEMSTKPCSDPALRSRERVDAIAAP